MFIFCKGDAAVRRLWFRNFLWCLVLSIFWSGLAGAQTETLSLWPEVPAGIEYLHRRSGDEPWSIHVVKIDRTQRQFQFISSLAEGSIYGLSTLKNQVKSLAAGLGKPAAAVNGDFFVIRPGPYQGDPLGLQIIQGELVSAPGDISFWIDPKGEPHIGELVCRFRVRGPEGMEISLGLNQERLEDTAVLYTPALGPSTRTSGGGELVLERADEGPWLPLRAGMQYKARVQEVRDEGDTALRPDIMVLSIGPGLFKKLPTLQEGTILSLSLETDPDLKGVQTALGCRPVLVRKGKVQKWDPNQPRHPRTALGWNDKYYFLVVVDGRQPGLSMGMTFPELAELMLSYGCQEAVNLDGGGSSTLWLGGKVMNSPSDGRERSIANGLIVMQKRKK